MKVQIYVMHYTVLHRLPWQKSRRSVKTLRLNKGGGGGSIQLNNLWSRDFSWRVVWGVVFNCAELTLCVLYE